MVIKVFRLNHRVNPGSPQTRRKSCEKLFHIMMHPYTHAPSHNYGKSERDTCRHTKTYHLPYKLHGNWGKSQNGGRQTYIQIKTFSTFNKGTFLIGHWNYAPSENFPAPSLVELKLCHRIQFGHAHTGFLFALLPNQVILFMKTFIIFFRLTRRWLTFCDFFAVIIIISSILFENYLEWNVRPDIQVHHRFINENVLYSIKFWSALIQFKSNFAMISLGIFSVSPFPFLLIYLWVQVLQCVGLIGHRMVWL